MAHRQYLLHLLQHFVCNLYAGLPTCASYATFTAGADILTMRYIPVNEPDLVSYRRSTRDFIDAEEIARFTTHTCPPTLFFDPHQRKQPPSDDAESHSQCGVFLSRHKDALSPRFQAMVDEFHSVEARPVRVPSDDHDGEEVTRSIRLATCVSGYGEYFLYTMGRFEVLRTKDGVIVRLLNGFVRMDLPEGEAAHVPTQ